VNNINFIVEGEHLMLFIFFQNMTVIITFIFLYNNLKSLLIDKKVSKRSLFVTTYILSTTLTLATMVNPFSYLGYSFDLRSVPLFYITYKKGWKLGLLTSILPALYRLSIGTTGVGVGIMLGMLLPVVMGAVFSRNQKNLNYSETIKTGTRRIVRDFVAFVILKQIILGFYVEIPLREWWGISISMAVFSTLTLLSIVVILNDSSKQIISEKRLRTSEERYRKLAEILPDGVLVYKDDKIVFANMAVIELIGIGNRDDEINYINEVILKKDKDGQIATSNLLKMLVDRKIESGASHHKIRLENGLEIDIEIRGISFNSEGQVFVINVIRDITSMKRTQLLEEKIKHDHKVLAEIREYDRLKTEFFANLSHELKTPLNLLFSTVQLMELDVKDKKIIDSDKVNKRIRILKQNCNRMVKLTNNLIDITKVDSGYFELQLQNCDIVRITEEITLSVAEYIESNRIELVFDTNVEEKIIAVDPNAMERIMLNLLSNAVKFSKPNNQILVSIYDYGENIVISVKDSGHGIPEDKLGVIFERFRQVDRLLNRRHEGSGIGLSLVKSLVTMHGGEISVESEYGEGTEFIIKLPTKITGEICKLQSIEEFKNRYVESVNIEFSDIYSL